MPRKSQLSKDILEKYYIQEKLSARQISKILNLSLSYIHAKIRKFGIPRFRHCIDLTGEKFGKLMVIKYSYSNRAGSIFWECLCECGKTTTVRASGLRNYIKSCGCLKDRSYGEMGKSYFSRTQYGAATRDIEFKVSHQYILGLFRKQNGKCALSGVEIKFNGRSKRETTASLDRIDSSQGYIEGNVQWVHKRINYLKRDLPERELNYWVNRLYEHGKLKAMENQVVNA